MDFIIKDDRLTFKGLEVGRDIEGKISFDFDALRSIVIASTRFATGREIEPRSLKALTADVSEFVANKNISLSEKDEQIKQLKKEVRQLKKEIRRINREDLHNAAQFILSLENEISIQNQQYNELQRNYVALARALEEQQKGA